MGGGTVSGASPSDTDGLTEGAVEEPDRNDEPSTGPADTELSDAEVFDLLRNSRRRAALTYLFEDGHRASVKELTEHVAATEYDTDVGELSADQYKRVYTALYQCHLPRLDEFGVIDFDKDRTEVRLSDGASRVESYLYQRDNATAVRLELALAAVVASLVTLGLLGIGPLGRVSVFSWAILTALALLAVAAVQLYVTSSPS